MRVGAPDEQLNGRQDAGDGPDGGDDERRARLGDARPERKVDDAVTIDADRHRSEHRGGDADRL